MTTKITEANIEQETLDNLSFTANSASDYANSAFNTSNTNTILAQAAFDQANGGGSSAVTYTYNILFGGS